MIIKPNQINSLGISDDYILQVTNGVLGYKNNPTLLVGADTKDPTGFVDRSQCSFSYNSAIYTFIVVPTSVSYDIYFKGKKITISETKTKVITNTEGLWYFYFDENAIIQATQTFSNVLITDYVLIAIMYLNATSQQAILIGDERHGISMTGKTHEMLHNTLHTQYSSGLLLENILYNQNGGSNTHAQFSMTSGVIYDEDIRLEILAKSLPATIPVFYKSGNNGYWRTDTQTNYFFLNAVDGLPYYNQWTGTTWQLTEVANKYYVPYHIFATNDINGKEIISIMGQNQYNKLNDAQTGVITEISNILNSDMFSTEFILLETLFLECKSNFRNTVKCRLVN